MNQYLLTIPDYLMEQARTAAEEEMSPSTNCSFHSSPKVLGSVKPGRPFRGEPLAAILKRP